MSLEYPKILWCRYDIAYEICVYNNISMDCFDIRYFSSTYLLSMKMNNDLDFF